MQEKGKNVCFLESRVVVQYFRFFVENFENFEFFTSLLVTNL